MKEKYFSEFRPHDYRTPRSLRECYGWDTPLWVEEEEPRSWGAMLFVMVAAGMAAIAFLPLIKKLFV